jgi:GGDEF domain-containing protein
VFQGIYQMVCRMMRRGGQSAYLMLCTVVDSKGNPMKDGVLLDELSQRLGDAIRNSVRQSDAINRYGKGQYLLLLVNATRENCGIVQKRINQNFLVGRQRTGIQYYVNSVVCTPEKERILMEEG